MKDEDFSLTPEEKKICIKAISKSKNDKFYKSLKAEFDVLAKKLKSKSSKITGREKSLLTCLEIPKEIEEKLRSRISKAGP